MDALSGFGASCYPKFSSDGKIELEMDEHLQQCGRCTGPWSLIVQSIYIPTLTYGREVWVARTSGETLLQRSQMS